MCRKRLGSGHSHAQEKCELQAVASSQTPDSMRLYAVGGDERDSFDVPDFHSRVYWARRAQPEGLDEIVGFRWH
jgi:hypothetical protein